MSLSPVFLACDKNLLKAAEKEGLKALNVESAEDRAELEKLLGRH